jgi:hypothetical protein
VFAQFAKDFTREITTNGKIMKYFSPDVILFGYSMFQFEAVIYLNIINNFLIEKIQSDVVNYREQKDLLNYPRNGKHYVQECCQCS